MSLGDTTNFAVANAQDLASKVENNSGEDHAMIDTIDHLALG